MTSTRMARFHTLEVASIHQETADCIVVGFTVPASEQADFRFEHGQYVTLKLTVNGEELRRSYSICSSPLDQGEMRIAVKKVEGGRASTQLVDKLKPGMQIEVMTPMGNFTTALDPSKERHIIAFAAGSGITPILSRKVDSPCSTVIPIRTGSSSAAAWKSCASTMANAFPYSIS